MFGKHRSKSNGNRWQDASAQQMQDAALPLLELALAALKSHGELVVSPGSDKAVAYLEALLDASDRLSGCSRVSCIQEVREDVDKRAGAFGEWQRQEVENMMQEMGDAVHTLVEDARTSLTDQDQVVEGVTSIQNRLEAVKDCTDIARMRQAIRTEIAAAREIIQRQTHAAQTRRQELEKLVKNLARRVDVAECQRNTDTLTNVGSRASFDYQMAATSQRANYGEGPFSLALLDMDGLKAINDQYGHQAGDAALAQFAAMLVQHAGVDAYVARMGGDEFAVISPCVPSVLVGQMSRLCDRLARAAIAVSYGRKSEKIRLGCSAGVAPFKAGTSVKDTMAIADKALYDAKQSGKGQVRSAFGLDKAA